jgi:hypothetical protein
MTSELLLMNPAMRPTPSQEDGEEVTLVSRLV